MIGVTKKGTAFGGLLRYILSSEKRATEDAHMIAGTVDGRTIKQLTAEFDAVRRLRPGLKKVVYHQMLRAPAEEGLRLTDQTWAAIAALHAHEMGYFEGQWLAVRHGDHVHIVANRVLEDGSVVSDSHDYARAEASVRKIEEKFGLTKVEASHLLEPARAAEHERAPSQAELVLKDKGEEGVRSILQDQLIAVLDREQSFGEFIDRLYERGVLVRPNVQSTGRIAGLSFAPRIQPDLEFKGSRLGRGFTFPQLQKKGLRYDSEADREAVERSLQRCNAVDRPEDAERPAAEDLPRTLADPREAYRHLDKIGLPVVLGARQRDGSVIELGMVTSGSLRRWRRRLRRRCAWGQEILIRPAEDAHLILLPRCPETMVVDLKEVGIEPCIVVDTVWRRKDLWVRAGGGKDGHTVQELRDRLRAASLHTVGSDDVVWGHLAGYTPDPTSAKTTHAALLKNRIILMADAVVDLSQDLFERIREFSRHRRRSVTGKAKRHTSEMTLGGKGRSR